MQWVDLLTPTTTVWVDVFDAALMAARERFRFVQASAASSEVDLLVAAFEVQHLGRVVEEQRVVRLLDSPTRSLGELVVVVCGRIDPMPQSDEIAALLDEPRLLVVPRRGHHAPQTPEEFEPVCARLLLRLATRHQQAVGTVYRPLTGAVVDEIEGS